MPNALVFTVANILLFQVGWFICILCGSYWALSYTVVVLLLHFYCSPVRVSDLLAIALSVLIGFAHDSILIRGGYIHFVESASWPPIWLVCLWALLGATLNHSLRWIYPRPLLSAGFGVIGGPLSYLAGVKLSSAQWSSPLVEVVPIIATLWLLVLPLHRFLSMRIKPYVPQ
jgi:hypothetical protein